MAGSCLSWALFTDEILRAEDEPRIPPPVLSGDTVRLARKPNCLKEDRDWPCQSILSSLGVQHLLPVFSFIGP